MKGATAALLTLAFVAATCSAHVLSQEAKPVVGVDVQTEKLGKELAEVGHILVNVAKVVANQGKSDEGDAYMFGDIWHTIKTAVKETGRKFTDAAKNAVNDVKQTLQKAAEKAKQRAQEKAFEILARIMGDSMAAYAAEDFNTYRKDMCTKIERVGKKLIAEGERLSRH